MKRKRSIGSITALLLSFLLLFRTNVISDTTGTVSEDETAGVEVLATASGNQSSESPANPIHHCNKESAAKDTATWSYVYFGSYPQSEVTDSAVNICSCSGGVCPALYINLSSDIWLMKDDGIIPTIESPYRDKSQD